MWQLLLSTALLLLVSAGTQAADLPKAVVLLDPQWDQVLKDDTVTLKCLGDYALGDSSTKWWHNGSFISNQASSFTIEANVEDSGEYKCQTSLSALSDPVHLEVHVDWLLLQAPQRVVKEGEPIWLRCHSWKNRPVHKVQYFRNGRGQMFYHWNSYFNISKATLEHSGSYFCRGLIGNKNESSKAVDITVKGLENPPFFPTWHQIALCLLLGLLFAVDTGLYFSVQRDLRSSKKDWRGAKVTWSQGSQDK
ncbi:low affinity immunoglobulin gamma Fc region receptor III-A-like isoform X1 [Vicugna pacos]|uniref:low affinity immunoglobulin gamma Fc region receptor III-A-like isoform X1 n=1 Tax=Vicugna pacos TaxID=30538 RepID=UPI000737E6E3|nr:low affinity immunoglobulin gamma Fc region receptor III-like isoform X1 [Vicugna pacos]